MPDLTIKPNAGSGNKVIIQDQAGGAVMTTADSGATLGNSTQDNITRLGTVTTGNISNSAIVYPTGHVIQTVVSTKNDENSANRSSQTTAKVVDGSGNEEWNCTITGVLANSHVKIQMSFRGFGAGNSGTVDAGYGFAIYRGSSIIYQQHYYEYYTRMTGASFAELGGNWHLHWLDTSPATGSNTYYLGYRSFYTSQGYVSIQSASPSSPFTCILQEIAQ